MRALPLGLGAACARPPAIGGGFVEPNWPAGHRLREGRFAPPREERRAAVVIAGGGVAGLSAAWKLERSGFFDFVLLELEEAPGGNARAGAIGELAHPWGAHYVPLPGPECRAVRELFRELRIIVGEEDGAPVYDETMLCQAPEHRLHQGGRWIDGLFPRLGATQADRDQLARLQALYQELRVARGGDGRRAFTLPMALSSEDPRFRALDERSMAAWLDEQGVHSPRVRWWVEYGLRDDYGTTLETTSAWAGLHYACARGVEDPEVLTWPEGNGWIVQRLWRKLRPRIFPGHMAIRLEPGQALALDLAQDQVVRYRCQEVIAALPHHVAVRTVAGMAREASFTYAPWVVANLRVRQVPAGAAWDNVFYQSESLGYVVSTHQSLSVRPGPAVLSWYRPLCRQEPGPARAALLGRSWASLRDEALADLERAHPRLSSSVEQVDVVRFGHGMIRPTPGFLFGGARARAASAPGVHLAHSDLSGLSLFEEAQYRGVAAAEAALTRLGHPFASSL